MSLTFSNPCNVNLDSYIALSTREGFCKGGMKLYGSKLRGNIIKRKNGNVLGREDN